VLTINKVKSDQNLLFFILFSSFSLFCG